MSETPAAFHSIDLDELRAVLEQHLCRHFARPCSIHKLERRPAATHSSYALEELDVCLDDGTELQIFFKDVGPTGMLQEARRVKPAFLYDPLREIETYRVFLAPNDLGTATCYGAAVDPAEQRYWLFLEKVPGLELYYVALPTWQDVARWLAAWHARFAMDPELQAQAREAHLLHYDASVYRTWMRRAQKFAGASALEEIRQALSCLAERYGEVANHLAALPPTLIHGEFYASNVLVEETPAGLRVCPVDWEMAALGPGLLDLAALIAGSWSEEDKTLLALAYHDALETSTGAAIDTEDFLTTLDYCRLHLALQWLGWSSAWSPPLEHAQNWLQEALRLSRKLGLCDEQ